ncbi:hypothetical protein ACTJIL_05275 [Luteimonas sp. 22616]|uniref:hypothetical protein n=1 Tax=Luteimonas sp. 22616 TaxID=3453951 RepID=UPI003F85AE5E
MIVRGPLPEARYYVLRNEIADDSSLSWAARGVLIHLLTKPSDWRVSVAALVNQTKGARIKSGRDSVYALLKELEKAGYVKRERTRSADGKLGEVDYIVSEGRFQPLPAQPDTANPTEVITERAVRTNFKSKDLTPPERTHRKKRDKSPTREAKVAEAKIPNHPIWNRELSRLTAEGVSIKRARACLAKLVDALNEGEALDLLESAREAGNTGSMVIDEIMRRVYAETR